MSNQDSSEKEAEVPADMSLREAYAIVRAWYQGQLAMEPSERWIGGNWWEYERELIEALPDPGLATEGEIMFCFSKISAGDLEFGFGGRAEGISMGTYARTMLSRFPELAEIAKDPRL